MVRIADMIRAKVASGDLPLDRPEKMYVGYGRDNACDACELLIHQAQMEYELDFPAQGRTYRLHLGCAGLLEGERLKRGEPPVGR